MKHFHSLLLTLIILSGCVPAVAQETFKAVYSFDSIRSKSGGRIDPTPVPKAAGLSFGQFKAVPATGNPYKLSETSSSSKAFAFTGWPVHDSIVPKSSEMDVSQYYTFKITPAKGTVYKVEYVTFKVIRTSTGPRKYAVRGSMDGFANNLTASLEKEYDNAAISADNSIDMDDINKERTCQFRVTMGQTLSDPAELRFYAWRAESQTAPFKLDDVVVYGTVLQRDSATAIGSDTLSWSTKAYDTWQTTIPYIIGDEAGSLVQRLLFPRNSSDAAVEICNMHDSLQLTVREIQIQLTDSTGADVSSLFEIKSSPLSEVAPFSAGVLKIRLIPKHLLTEVTDYTLQGTIRYLDPSDGKEKTTLLYPTTVSFPPTTSYKSDCFVPLHGGRAMALQVRNTSQYAGNGVEVQTLWQNGRSDTLRIGTLRPNGIIQYVSTLGTDSKSTLEPDSTFWNTPSCKSANGPFDADSLLAAKPVFHRLYRMVSLYTEGHDDLPDMLVDDVQDENGIPEKIYSSQGTIYNVLQADSFLTETAILPARDSVAEFHIKLKSSGWNYARMLLPLSMRQREVLSVERTTDAVQIHLDNVWTTEGGWLHLADSSMTASGNQDLLKESYRLCFSTLNLPPVITELEDSICLGDEYNRYGFELPSFATSGDYQFADTLLAVSGADSIVQLSLNVCTKPSEPGRITGDSIVVKAGSYQYTISPVPEAAFYVWSVFPSDWQLTGSGETVTLNVPYDGKGVLSVKAVNRCGSSSETTLNLATENQKGAFVVYPDDVEGTFILETDGMEGMTTIAVSDLNGTLIYKEEKQITATDRSFRFTLIQPSGMYIISIVNKNARTSQKLQK